MRKSLFFLFVLFFGFKAYSQNDYYWSSNKKNYLTVDSSTVVIKTTAPEDKVKAMSFLRNSSGATIPQHHFDSVHMYVKFTKKMRLNDVSASLSGSNVKVSELIYAYFYNNKEPLVPDGVILCQLKPGVKIEDIKILIGQNEVDNAYTDEYHVTHITPVHLKRVFAIANKLYEGGLATWSHPDFIVKIVHSSNDPNYTSQYYLKNTGQTGGTSGIDINVEPAWAVATGNSAIRVAVIDDGVEAHEDLGTRVVQGYTPLISNGYGAPSNSAAGHGEACAGIIAATKDNNLGIAGICPTAIIVPVNIFVGGETTGNIASAISWAYTATQGNADVLSCSWGGGAPADAITNAITAARTNGRGGKGTVVVFAAGNYTNNNVPIAYPSSVNGVIAVGAIDKYGARWNYSPNSPSLVAPSGNVNLAGDIVTIDRMGSNGFNGGNYMSNFGGTSAACPQVAGVAALMLQMNPNLTETLVRNAIINSATQMYNSVSFGSGRLNAYAAIQASAPAITGVAAFCNMSVFTVSPIPAGATVVWSSSTSGVVSLAASGNQVTATKLTQGWTTLTATITGGNGGNIPPSTLNITTYPAENSISSTMSGSCTNNYQTWLLQANPNMQGATNFHWFVQNPTSGIFNIFSPNSQSTYVSVSGGGGISVTYTDLCGETSSIDGVTIYSPCGRAGMAIVAYPNPAGNQLTIQNSNVTQPEQTVMASAVAQISDPFSVELFNDKGAVLKAGTTPAGNNNIVLNTSDIANGIYFLHIKHGSEVIEKQIIIHH